MKLAVIDIKSINEKDIKALQTKCNDYQFDIKSLEEKFQFISHSKLLRLQ